MKVSIVFGVCGVISSVGVPSNLIFIIYISFYHLHLDMPMYIWLFFMYLLCINKTRDNLWIWIKGDFQANIVVYR